ncbi:hypothetical protein BN946_scf184799.g13 [Trametes cinnabarina]|uniref:Protein-S-isoprenylcysteine O-methyltransferase n=1 Tax=Pycnoporus cinnabarinus TaxID=5643 RepID=A0A060S2D4_PYCCI|nr:hypothetical protein BN946_scf184799.g13 [Trametes cinnabarina]
MHASLAKAALLVADTVCIHYGLSPPGPPPSPTEQQRFFKPDALAGTYWLHSTCVCAWRVAAGTLAIVEAATILARHIPPRYASAILTNLPFTKGVLNLRMTSTFLAGSALAIAGGLIRICCHHALGKFFTWQLSVQDGHKLVTAGPYAIVRHPSYVGWALITLGMPLALFTPGSYFVESGLAGSRLYRSVAGAAVLYMAFLTMRLLRRVPKEDEVLSTHFGDQWRAWAKTTPYKLVPFIY